MASRRPRRADPNYDEDREPSATTDEIEPVPMWKTVAVVVVVVGCFVAVYPKMFHPMLLYALGYNKAQLNDAETERISHPGARHPGASYGRVPERHMPPSGQAPPPPMRMGPQSAAHVDAQKTGGKAMWHWMLPFYTVGVIVFLLYTLGKIFWKQPKRLNHQYNFRYNNRRDRFEVNRNGGDIEDEEDEDSADDDRNGTLNDRELRRLQGRLQETETAMHKILGQLEQLSGAVDPTTADNLKRMTLETLNNIGEIESKKSKLRGDGRKSKKEDPPPNTTYIKDLEKALNDFKVFTENYIEEHTKSTKQPTINEDSTTKDEDSSSTERDRKSSTPSKHPKKEKEAIKKKENVEMLDDRNDSDDVRDDGFDAMEGEDLNNLTLENGEGELINLDDENRKASPFDQASNVRRRKHDKSDDEDSS